MRPFGLIAAAALLLSGSRAAAAQLSIVVNGAPGPLSIVTAVAGSQPAPVTDGSTTYTATIKLSRGASARITGQLDANMPAGTTLTVSLSAVGGGTSAGAVALDVTPRNLVSNIGNTGNKTATGTITYKFTATTGAGVVAAAGRTVTFTIVSP